MIISQSKDLAGLTRRENSLTLDCFLPATHPPTARSGLDYLMTPTHAARQQVSRMFSATLASTPVMPVFKRKPTGYLMPSVHTDT